MRGPWQVARMTASDAPLPISGCPEKVIKVPRPFFTTARFFLRTLYCICQLLSCLLKIFQLVRDLLIRYTILLLLLLTVSPFLSAGPS